MESDSLTQKVSFGAFTVDLRSGELRKHDVRLKLQDQPFQVLALLIERAGDLVTREELQQRLWSADTFVDFDTGLNTAIKKLRDVLGDSAEEPRYIETLPRRGYRFIADVRGSSGNGDRPVEAVAQQPAVEIPAALVTPRSSRKWNVIIASCAALLLIAAFVSWRAYRAHPQLSKTDTILVASFVNRTADPLFDSSLDKALEVKLSESPFLSLFSEPEVRATLRMMRRDPAERLTRDLAIEICHRQGLRAFVLPEIISVGSKYLITLDAIDAQSQKSIARLQIDADSKERVIATLGRAGSQLRRQLGESVASLEKFDKPLDHATTASLEALQSYRAGLMQFRLGNLDEAVALFQKSIELDPRFCSAYRVLGAVFSNLGDPESSSKYHARAFELNDNRLTQEETFLTTATYHLSTTGNLEKAMAELILYRDTYPRSAIAHNVLGAVYIGLGRTEDALREFQWAVNNARVPAATDWGNVTLALMMLDRFDEARNNLDQWWQTRGSLSPGQDELRYRLAFFERDNPTMDRIAKEVPGDRLSWINLQEQFAFFSGSIPRMRSLSEASVNRQKQARQMNNAARELAWRARLEAYLGDFALARRLCQEAAKTSPTSDLALAYCAEALAQGGDIDQAESLAQKLETLRPEDTLTLRIHIPIIRSVIEQVRTKGTKSVELLAPVARYERGDSQVLYYRAQAYLSAGQHANAAAEFEKLLSHHGWTEWEAFAPLAQLELARAHAALGDRAKARLAYEEFFANWRAADPAIPLLIRAKSEYKKLTTIELARVSASQAGE